MSLREAAKKGSFLSATKEKRTSFLMQGKNVPMATKPRGRAKGLFCRPLRKKLFLRLPLGLHHPITPHFPLFLQLTVASQQDFVNFCELELNNVANWAVLPDPAAEEEGGFHQQLCHQPPGQVGGLMFAWREYSYFLYVSYHL